MADLPLLVNSSDSALLASNATPSVYANGLAGGGAKSEGFATILDKQLMPGEGVAATESPPPIDGTRSISGAETGESPPSDGKALPPVATEGGAQTDTEFSGLDAALVSAIAPNIPTVSINSSNAQLTGTATTSSDPALLKQDAVLRAAVQQAAQAQANGELSTQSANGAATSLSSQATTALSSLNMATNPQATAVAAQNNASVLPNAAQDAQRAASLPSIPNMLGKSISSSAEQALERASLNAGKAQYFRTEQATAAGTTAVNNQSTPSFPGLSMGLQNLMGSTQRVDMFNAVMGGMTQTDTQAELRLPTNTVPANTLSALASTPALPDATVNLSADAPRLPGVAGNGFSSMLTVSTPVGQPAWANEMGQRVTWLANNELREAQLQLHPRSLGAVDVRISYGHEHQMHVSFSAANPIARDALEASLPRLREMFEQQGLNLADANISHESPREQQHGNGMTNGSSVPAEDYAGTHEPVDADGLQPPTRQWLSEGMLNAYA